MVKLENQVKINVVQIVIYLIHTLKINIFKKISVQYFKC